MGEKRKFSVHPNTIYDYITAQAGSLEKAVLECAMNSVDAHATHLDIQVTGKTIRIQDDGQGFRSRKEIEDWFEVFGFPHEAESRTYGKFGIGRGQLWSFCSTIWRTGTFQMDVDFKRLGLDYELIENLEPVKGLLIEGQFYTPLITSELAWFEKAFADLARYAPIPITLNGERISTDPATEKWDLETPDAWIRTQDVSQLAVYNLGVLVTRYPAQQFGCGGVVVSKPGAPLALNTARNDVLVAQCVVWKRIRTTLQKHSDQRVRTKRTRLSDAELENLAKRFIAGELDYDTIEKIKLVTDIVGRGHTVDSLVRRIGRGYGASPLTVAELGSQIGERAHSRKLAFVLSPVSLERFGVESVKAFKSTLHRALAVDPNEQRYASALKTVKIFEDVSEAVPTLRDGHDVLRESDLSKFDRAGLRALSEMAYRVRWALIGRGLLSTETAHRTMYLGVSDVAEAWTDGRSLVVVERRQLQLMSEGVGGFMGLATLLVHEYLHDDADIGSHTHDLEFYSRYHAATVARAGILNQAALQGLHKWVVVLHSMNLRVPRTAAGHLDQIEQFDREAAQTKD